MPHEYPPWSTVAGYYRDWRRDGTWQAMHDAVREQVRVAAGREATPSAAIIGSQSVKSPEKATVLSVKGLETTIAMEYHERG